LSIGNESGFFDFSVDKGHAFVDYLEALAIANPDDLFAQVRFSLALEILWMSCSSPACRWAE
jgi:hypothetical protein